MLFHPESSDIVWKGMLRRRFPFTCGIPEALTPREESWKEVFLKDETALVTVTPDPPRTGIVLPDEWHESDDDGLDEYEEDMVPQLTGEEDGAGFQGTEEQLLFWKAMAQSLLVAKAPIQARSSALLRKAFQAFPGDPLLMFNILSLDLREEDLLRAQVDSLFCDNMKRRIDKGNRDTWGKLRIKASGEEVLLEPMLQADQSEDSVNLIKYLRDMLSYARVEMTQEMPFSVQNYKYDVRALVEVEAFLIGARGLSLRLRGRGENFGTYRSYSTTYCTRATILPTRSALFNLQREAGKMRAIDILEEEGEAAEEGVTFRSSAPDQTSYWRSPGKWWDFTPEAWRLMKEALLGPESEMDSESAERRLKDFRTFIRHCIQPSGRQCSISLGFSARMSSNTNTSYTEWR